MKQRNLLYLLIIVVILALSGIFYFNSLPGREPVNVFAATVQRDCAPWDGAAFTVSIPHESGVVIYVSIWQSPDIRFPSTFSFPDDTGQLGNAYILSELGPLEILSGRVTLQRVEVGTPVEGRFSFTSERGVQFKGQFQAEWDNQVVFCG